MRLIPSLRVAAAATLLLCLSSAASGQFSPIDGPLVVIRRVGREGKGNAEAAAAWKRLVRTSATELPYILMAIDDDNPRAGNWLRTAVDAIAERTLEEGKKLPVADLEAFVKDRSSSRGARRQAYEWLVRVDPAAPTRLLPTMLDDPSAELRRDAVAALIKQAALLAKTDKNAANALYKKAFAAACDQDQVDALAKILKEQGETVDLSSHFGMLKKWHLAGVFDNTAGAGYKAVYPPEQGVDPKAVYKGKGGEEVRWVEQVSADGYGVVDLNKLIGKKKEVVAYAYAVVDSPTDQRVQIRAGCITALKVFVNGKEVLGKDEYHHGMRMDQYIGDARLKKGRNELLLKVCQNNQSESWAQDWKFQIRLTDPAGATVKWTQVAAGK